MPAVRILLVEDEVRLAEMIRRVLVAERHVVDVAPDGVSALALAQRSSHDVIVLDRMLPDLEGAAVLRVLRGRASRRPC
jgi:DNA-binding response OmpR family regulator